MAEAKKMRVAVGQFSEMTDDKLQFAVQLGVGSVQMNSLGSAMPGQTHLTVEQLVGLRRKAEEYGLVFEAIENVPIQFYLKAMLGLPGRDEEIASYQTTIRNMGAAGIPVLGYHFMPNSVWSTSHDTSGRGGSRVRVFDMATVAAAPPDAQRAFAPNIADERFFEHLAETTAHPVSEAQMWENYAYFMHAVLPVAEEAGVVLALHPDDPPVDELGGVARLFKNVNGFKKAYEMVGSSPAWALDLCLGCCSEMVGGKQNVREMIEFFAPKGKISYIHFRDVKGSVPHFAECFIGEGNYNAAETMLLLKKNGFTGFLLDDHVPHMLDDSTWNHRGRAHAIGYMQGLLDMIETTGA